MPDPFSSSRLFAHIARDLVEQPGLEKTTSRLLTLARQLTGCGIAALWKLSPSGDMLLQASTDPAFGHALRRILHDVDEGVVRQALTSHAVVHMPDTSTERRWPRYLQALAEHQLPIACAVAYSLDLGEHQLGVLALYSAKPYFFSEDLMAIGAILADHAAIALEAADLADQNHHLNEALQTNRRIGIAIGILMALHQVEEQQAFDLLRIASQRLHRKLRDIAEEVILTGATPPWPARKFA